MKEVRSPTVLVIADDLKLVESLRGAFGSACRVFLSPNVEAGLERVRQTQESLCAVLMNLSLPGLNADEAIAAVRRAHGDVTVLGFTPPEQGAARIIDGCRVVALPVDWRDLRNLVDIQRVPESIVSRKPGTMLPELPSIVSRVQDPPKPTSAPLTQDSDSKPEPSIASSFLRDEADLIEHANHFRARSSKEGVTVQGRILRVTSRFVVCEILSPVHALPPQWQADEAEVKLASTTAYRGPAKLAKVVNTGQALVCEWALQGEWSHASPLSNAGVMPQQPTLAPFFDRMRILRRISDVFKAVIAEVASMLDEARQCLDRIEAGLVPGPGQSRTSMLRTAALELRKDLFPAFDQVFAKFELASKDIPADLDAEYHSLVRQHLHPLMMCAPFIHHVYAKPLGFAGDFAALQKLLGDPFEGHTLFAKLLNAWLIASPAGEAYRHRVQLLTNELQRQASRCHSTGHGLRVLSIGCGAAPEIARFIELDELSHASDITLVDFNEPTLECAKQQVNKARQEHWRLANVSFVQSSVQSIILDERRSRRQNLSTHGSIARASGYDFIYCAGLFDYFSDRVCRRLLEAMHWMLAPGGRIIVCNFTPSNPIRQFMKYVLDWNLIHRTEQQLRALLPTGSPTTMIRSPQGVEVYLTLDRPMV